MSAVDHTFLTKVMPKAYGIDVYGDPRSNRPKFNDHLNSYMFNNMIKEYVNWHETNHRFYDNFKKDKTYNKFLYFMQYAWAGVGLCFAGMVINPNYTSPRSFYLRKINDENPNAMNNKNSMSLYS